MTELLHHYYVLDINGEPQPVDDVNEWATWYGGANRRVAKTGIAPGVFVSTVFLAINHQFDGSKPPLLYETMVFGSEEYDDIQYRYETKAEALAGHDRVCAELRGKLA